MRTCTALAAAAVSIFSVSSSLGQQIEAGVREKAFVDRYLQTCFASGFSYDAVAAEATAKGWIAIDPLSTPFELVDKTGKGIAARSAWKTNDPLGPFIVHTAKIANAKVQKDCDVAGFDLDGNKVVALLIADGRFKDTMGIPLRGGGFLHFDNGNLIVNTGNPPPPETAAGHVTETYIKTM